MTSEKFTTLTINILKTLNYAEYHCITLLILPICLFDFRKFLKKQYIGKTKDYRIQVVFTATISKNCIFG